MDVTTELQSPCVYVVNETLVRDGSGFRTLHDLTPAAEFGALKHILPGGPVSPDPEARLAGIRRGLSGFRATDYLLPVGNPLAIGCAIALAAQLTGGPVRVLRWQRRDLRYEAAELNLSEQAV